MNTPLNPDALEKASREVFREVRGFDKSQSTRVARRAIAAYLAVAQPVVNSVEDCSAYRKAPWPERERPEVPSSENG